MKKGTTFKSPNSARIGLTIASFIMGMPVVGWGAQFAVESQVWTPKVLSIPITAPMFPPKGESRVFDDQPLYYKTQPYTDDPDNTKYIISAFSQGDMVVVRHDHTGSAERHWVASTKAAERERAISSSGKVVGEHFQVETALAFKGGSQFTEASQKHYLCQVEFVSVPFRKGSQGERIYGDMTPLRFTLDDKQVDLKLPPIQWKPAEFSFKQAVWVNDKKSRGIRLTLERNAQATYVVAEHLATEDQGLNWDILRTVSWGFSHNETRFAFFSSVEADASSKEEIVNLGSYIHCVAQQGEHNDEIPPKMVIPDEGYFAMAE